MVGRRRTPAHVHIVLVSRRIAQFVPYNPPVKSSCVLNHVYMEPTPLRRFESTDTHPPPSQPPRQFDVDHPNIISPFTPPHHQSLVNTESRPLLRPLYTAFGTGYNSPAIAQTIYEDPIQSRFNWYLDDTKTPNTFHLQYA